MKDSKKLSAELNGTRNIRVWKNLHFWRVKFEAMRKESLNEEAQDFSISPA